MTLEEKAEEFVRKNSKNLPQDLFNSLVELFVGFAKELETEQLIKAKKIIQKCLQFMPSGYNDMGNTDIVWEIRDEAEQFLRE